MSFFEELKRRNIVKVAMFYVVASWIILQVADFLFEALDLPSTWVRLVLALLTLGFPLALIISWLYELTPEGLKRESEIDRSHSITRETGRRLNLVTIAMVAVVVGLLLADRFMLDRRGDAPLPAIDNTTPIVAVLPFKATGSDDGGFLAAGLHDDLLTRLAKLDAFKVISRTSMMEYAETTKNMRQIGEELGAGYILEGGVQAMGNRVRINAQLIDAPADDHIWAEIYDRELTAANLFDIQAELALAIAGELQTALSDSDRILMDAVPTRSIEAYNAYLRGLDLRNTGTFTISNLGAVVTAFEESVSLDPEFALGWARLSQTHSGLAQLDDDVKDREAALFALAKARALQPDLQETELAWVVYLYRGLSEYQQALDALEALGKRAALDADSLTLKAWLLRRVGRFEDAYRTMLEAQQLEPRSSRIGGSLINLAYQSNDCESAGRHARAALSLAPDSDDDVRTSVANYELECTGNAHRASELLQDSEFVVGWHLWTARTAALFERDYERALELSMIRVPGPGPFNPIRDQLFESVALHYLGRDEDAAAILDAVADALAALEREGVHDRGEEYAFAMSWYHSMRGDGEATRRWVEEHRQRFRKENKGDRAAEANAHRLYAIVLARAGLHDEAIAELRVMFEEPGGFGFRFVDAFPDFDALRDHPGYIELRARFGDRR